MRRWLLALLLLGLAGTALELVLLGHYEGGLQWLPLVVLGLGLAALVWCAASPGAASLCALRIAMAGLIATGLAGIVLHGRGNAEFQKELDPSLGGWRLFWKVVRAQSPPALAPAALAQLGLLGLVYTLGHPAPGRDDRRADEGGHA